MLNTLGYSKEFINNEIQPCDKVTADSEQTASRLSCLCAQMQVKPGHTQALIYADMASVGRERTSKGGILFPTSLGSAGCWFPYVSLGPTRPERLCANEC